MASVVSFSETADIETSSRDYARRFSGKIGAWFLKVQEEATLRILAAHPGARILDVGGGHGQLAAGLIRNGYEVTVLGSAEVCVEQIQDLVDHNLCSFKVGDILALPYGDRSFDVVLSYRLVPHVTQWQRFLSEIARVANKAVVIDFPSNRSINYIAPLLFPFKKRLEGNTRPFACFDEIEIVKEFAASGFAVAERYPEFFLPMVFHRTLKSPIFSKTVEKIFRLSSLTSRFGSPVILSMERAGK